MYFEEKNDWEREQVEWIAFVLQFPISKLTLWGNKNWPPSMKVKKVEKFQDKMGLRGCKWSSLNAPGTENPLSHPLFGLDEFPFPIIGPLG